MPVTQADPLSAAPQAASPAAPQVGPLPAGVRVRFSSTDSFQRKLRARVDRYLRTAGLRERDCTAMYVKTAMVLGWAVGSYVLLVFFSSAWWQALPLAISIGLATAAIGFNVQHDASHGAYSSRRWVNKLMALTLDLVGASSFVWARKHNTFHHTYTNIDGWDDDIDVGTLGRLSPQQKRYKLHRVQHLYLWVLYAFLPMKWQWFDDYNQIAKRKIGVHQIKRPRGWDLTLFVLGKAIFYFYALALPMLLGHSFWVVLLFYSVACFAQGVAISVVFQMAHVVEEARFPEPDPKTGQMAHSWAVHQVLTTVDFARHSRLLSWYVGGLNFQVEHHLFPRISHVHYPKISRLVERACRRAGVPYRANESLGKAIGSHYRWLRKMGRPENSPAIG